MHLLSRARVFVLNSLTPEDLRKVVQTALQDSERGLAGMSLKMEPDALDFLAMQRRRGCSEGSDCSGGGGRACG